MYQDSVVRGLLILICITTMLWGQAGHSEIFGIVRDEYDQSPLEGANVVLTGDSQRQLTGAATDARGVYRIPNISPGSYQLQVTYIGYRTVEQQVVVPTGESVSLEINIDLMVESILDVPEPRLSLLDFLKQRVSGGLAAHEGVTAPSRSLFDRSIK